MERHTYIALFLIGLIAPGLVLAGTTLILDAEPASGTIPIGAPDGPTVTVTGVSSEMELSEFTPNSSAVQVTSDAGNGTFYSGGNTAVTVDNMEGTWTNLSALNVTGSSLYINPSDKAAANVSGDADTFDFRDSFGVDDTTTDFAYSGTTGTTSVTLRGVPASTTIGASDQNGDLLDVSTSNSNGVVTFSGMANSQHYVTLNTGASASLSNPTPTGDLANEPSQISFQLNDTDFPDGDSVDVTIRLDGSVLNTQTITANQTVTASIPQSGQNGGAHTWSVHTNDSYGETSVLNASYNVPDQLTFYNETNTSEIVDSPVEITVNFIGDNAVYERSTTNGTINMTGLPVNENFIVEVSPSQTYVGRTVYIESIYQQQSVYLLNQNATSVQSRFVLEDNTGEFTQESVLFIQRAVNVSGSVEYQTIHADEFGVEGVTATLEEGVRYRIKIQSADGTEQTIGPYRADTSETVTVRPQSPTIPVGGDTGEGWSANAAIDNDTIEYTFSDQSGDTDLIVYAHERGNKSNTLDANRSYFDVGNVSGTFSLTVNQTGTEWVVHFVQTRDTETTDYTVTVGNRPDVVPGFSDEWRLIIGIGVLFISAGVFSLLNAKVGVTVIAIEGGVLWWLGWLEGATSGAGVVLALFVAVIVNLYTNR